MSSNRSGLSRLAFALFVVVLFAALLFLYVSQSIASRSIVAFGIGIKTAEQSAASLEGDSRFQDIDEKIRTGIAADPLNQKIIDSALSIVKAQDSEMDLSPWVATLRNLGWRNTSALQTLMNDAIQREDLAEIEIIADAMLRRKVLEEQAANLMSVMETDPEAQKRVLAKLQKPAPWRTEFLDRTGYTTVPAIVDARVETLQTLQENGDPLIRQEFAKFVANLVSVQRHEDAEQIWLAHTSEKPALIHDGDFQIAMSLSADEPYMTPFDWQLNSGNGFSADVSSDGLGGANVYIRWDGRGVPVFLSQLTAAKPGRYLITTKTDSDVGNLSRSLEYKLRCGGEVTNFVNRFDIRKNVMISRSRSAVECAFPRLDVSGRVADRRIESEFLLTSIEMVRTED